MKGIPFSPEMALAFREGRKHETRRVMNPQPDRFDPAFNIPFCGAVPVKPRYKVGDVCYVQETWAVVNYEGCLCIAYKSDGATADLPEGQDRKPGFWCGPWYYDLIDGTDTGWKSPRFMPAWAARTFVRVESVRVERVGQITEKDAFAEGAEPVPIGGWTPREPGPREWFAALWNRLHPKAPFRFEDDPWVWVYGIKETDGGGPATTEGEK